MSELFGYALTWTAFIVGYLVMLISTVYTLTLFTRYFYRGFLRLFAEPREGVR